ncbi:cytochrome P450 CYP82D47-like [Tripterygium wilfordii]|uniref:cytochrome P450 CYP82D47-like n=1 Tax=Tripterygium wilfordii TaxID=458696 RepID=UPI0018F7FBA0|nr:cytochrome P450 CYP82D47-like [Tripterygium wilfordii]
MEFLLSLPTNTIATTSFAVLLLYLCLRIFTNVLKPNKSKTSPPQAGGAWPLIGHLHLFRGPQPPHITLGKMADKHGPIFKIKLGVRPTLVISDSQIAKECFTTHDKILAGRPAYVALEIMGYNNAMFGFSPYGPYWRYTRKLATIELLSNKRLETFKHIRESEVKNAMKEMYQSWVVHNKSASGHSNHVSVDMSKILGDISSNVTYRAMVGKVYASKGEEDVRWKQVLSEYMKLLSNFSSCDALPFLRWFDFGGLEKSMKRTFKELDNYVEEWLQEHRKKRSSSGDGRIVVEDFMDVMLSIFDNVGEHENFTDYSPHTINKATCMSLLLGASDTTKSTMIWCLSLLLNHPDVLKKVQQELDAHIGPETLVNESDVKSFVYLDAVIKETLRLYSPGPLGLPHEAMEDCTVAGYHVPAGTQLLFNQWKMHQDPNVWEDPSEFKPERFLTTHKDIDFRGRHFEYLPFASGRRICPGISFAHQILMLSLANMLHGFDFTTPNGEPVDMAQVSGGTLIRATPLEALISPRLPGHVYMG